MAKKLGMALLVALGAALIWLGAARSDWLLVRNAEDQLLFETALPQKAEFAIRFTHSVALSPVEDWFVAQNGQVALNRTVYQDFGAGLPHDIEAGQTMTVTNGFIEISGYKLVLPQLEVRVGRVAGHELLVPGDAGQRRVPLNTLAQPGASLAFSVQSRSLAEVLWRHMTNEQRG